MQASQRIFLLSAIIAVALGCSDEREPPTLPPQNDPPATTPSDAPPAPTATTAETVGVPSGSSSSGSFGTSGGSSSGAVESAAAGSAVSSDQGQSVYQQFCSTCHGAAGAGDGPAAAALNPKPASFASAGFRLDPNGNGAKGERSDIEAVVRDGAAKYGGSPLMAPWSTLTPDQLASVTDHVIGLAKR